MSQVATSHLGCFALAAALHSALAADHDALFLLDMTVPRPTNPPTPAAARGAEQQP
ncbi:hypothetical protein ACFYWN_46575 [Streptomyces sp. NPDC002917]|uniref:hypothetical protein n=1 Tax=Streptomyces sp. NPDC002917 TaxID=3364671 RepID=UPI0036B6E06C